LGIVVAAPLKRIVLLLALVAAAGMAALPGAEAQVNPGAVVNNGTIALGIGTLGELTVSGGVPSSNCGVSGLLGVAPESIRWMATNDDGMDCDLEGEGWGLSYDSGAVSEWASGGSFATPSSPPPTLLAFVPTATSATSVVQIGDIQMTQAYKPNSVHANVYDDKITLQNVGATTHTHMLYRRVMAWGSAISPGWVSPDATRETIDTNPPGAPAPPVLIHTGIVGYAMTPDPTAFPAWWASGPPTAPSFSHVCVGGGYCDVSMVWDFDFGDLAPGASVSYTLYYGADASFAGALTTLVALNVQVYNIAESYGSSPSPSPVSFFMAFGNLPMPPPPPPVPPTAAFTYSSPTCGDKAFVHFTDASMGGSWNGSATTITDWQWDFGDGTDFSYEQNVDHTYYTSGEYNVILTVKDSAGQISTHALKLKIDVKACPPPVTKPEDNPREPIPPKDGQDAGIAAGDLDGDGIANALDNCPTVSNPDQADVDGDLHGDLCDTDMDGDGVVNASDNCPAKTNAMQTDTDGNGLGDACDVLPDASGLTDCGIKALNIACPATAEAARPADVPAESSVAQPLAPASGQPVAAEALLAALAVAGVILVVAARRRQR